MRFVTFSSGRELRPGVLLGDDRVLDIRAAAADVPEAAGLNSVLAVIQAGERGLETVAALVENARDDDCLALETLDLTAPLPRPEQLRDFANYEGHCLKAIDASMRLRAAAEDDPEAAYERMKASGAYRLPAVWYDIPLYYKGNRFATSGHDDDIIWPPFAENMDYELELAAVIGTRGRDIAEADAREHIFGYTIFNDFSARDIQARWEGQFRMGPAKGKDFDTSNAFGPCIVTRDEISDPYALTMQVRVNGEIRGSGVSGGSQHNFEQCIAQVSRSETIYPGEIFGLGTIEGGCGFESLTWLEDGDVIELEIEGIGVLRNRLVRQH